MQFIRKPNGEVIASIESDRDGQQKLYLKNGHFLGSYNPQSDKTYRANGSLFAQGNALTALLRQ